MQSLKSQLDKHTAGVIIISWGSMIRPDTLPLAKQKVLMESIRKFPNYLFVLKWPNNALPDQPKNLITREWLQQRDVLCHRNVKLFMTHGGLLGSSEAAHCGVPMLVTPFYGDQFLNAAALENRQVGLLLKYSEFTVDNIVNSWNRLLKQE